MLPFLSFLYLLCYLDRSNISTINDHSRARTGRDN